MDNLKQKIAELDPEILRRFILDLYQSYPDLSDRIETLALANDPQSLQKAIAKRIASLKRGRRFIDYRESAEFSRNMESIVGDIERGLLDNSPRLAFEVVDKFLATAGKVMERVDDSSGEISYVYREAVLLWLRSAKAWEGSTVDWQERVYKLYQENDYGVLDALLPNSYLLLTEDQLRQLAWRYESELRQAIREKSADDSLNWKAITGQVALCSVADALKDPALYERSVLIDSPEPNGLQKKSIVKRYIEYHQPDEAQRWLDTDWGTRFEADRQTLLEQLYEQSDNIDQLREIRQQIYQREKSYTSLERYLSTLSVEQQLKARQQAIQQAELGGDIMVNASLLLKLDEAERAQKLVVSRHDELESCFYNTLINLAKDFEKQACQLAATVCYRALLLGILIQGRSKTYAHAARYYKKLVVMAENIADFTPLEDNVVFLEKLETKHGRKRSFWERVR